MGNDDHWLAQVVVPALGNVAAGRSEIERAMIVVAAGLPPRDRAILRMHVAHGLGSEGVAKLMHLDRAAATKHIRELVRRVVNDVRSALAVSALDETAEDP